MVRETSWVWQVSADVRARDAIEMETHRQEKVIKVKHLRAHEIFGTNSADNYNVTPDSLISKHQHYG